MKKILAGISILMAIGSTACVDSHSVPRAFGGQLIDLDARTRLVVQVEGIQTKSGELQVESLSKEGDPIHRVLQSADGKVLFAYDLKVSRNGKGGAYNFLLKPSANGPTFAAARDVTMKAGEDAVKVELMEQPGTGRKVEDVFRLIDLASNSSESHDPLMAHLYAMHQRLYRWVHGE